MLSKKKMSHLEINARLEFLRVYNHILEQIYTKYGALPEMTKIDLCIMHAEFNRSMNQKGFDGNWIFIEKQTKVSWPNMFARMKNTKFVQVEDFSYENFLLSFYADMRYEIRSQYIDLPAHANLVKIYVPEELITKERQDTIYNSDWI